MTETTASLILASLAVSKLTPDTIKTLYHAAGSALDVLEHRNDIREICPDASDHVVSLLKEDINDIEQRVIAEQFWCEEEGIDIITFSDSRYPQRMMECDDAPLVIFSRGNADLNNSHMLGIVGTRKCTSYGERLINEIIRELSECFPDMTIVSGLAYGVDIYAHRAALKYGLPTIAVVAHGMDTLYPSLHRVEAERMCESCGGVVTEYFRGTTPLARNFLQRNRIIAGMSDAVLVVESASHGGGLVTARIAQDYNRDVLAIPGPVHAMYSEGCNNLIRDNKAQLVTSAKDIIHALNWQNDITLERARNAGIPRQLFVDLTTDEQCIVDTMRVMGDCDTFSITKAAGLPSATVNNCLFSLEMKGVIKLLAGNSYHLLS